MCAKPIVDPAARVMIPGNCHAPAHRRDIVPEVAPGDGGRIGRTAGSLTTRTSCSAGDNADRAELIDLLSDPDSHYARVDNHLLLRPLFAALPLRERRILTMRYFGDMSQAQIAAEIGISQMHVSRLLTQSLTRLRAGTRR